MIVQELLKKVNPETIWNIFCENYYGEISKLEWEKFNSYEYSHEEFLKSYNEALHYSLVANKECILIARNLFDTDEENNLISMPSVSLIKYKDLEKLKNIKEIDEDFLNSINLYGILFEDRKKILAYEIAQLSLKYCKIEEIVADIYWEMTWFGYDYKECTDRLKKEEEILIERVDSLDSDMANARPIDDLWDELCLEKPSEKEQIESRNALEKAMKKNEKINKQFFNQLKKEVSI